MMMRILEAGGLSVLTDKVRRPDDDNPRGYYEFERVKQIETDKAWLPDAQGKVVKMISALLKHLPPDYEYRIVFMVREMAEILASQRKMLVNRGEPTDKVADEVMARMFTKHLAQIREWLASQPNVKVLYVDYNETIRDPTTQVELINGFFEHRLDTAAMQDVIEPGLYRQRHPQASD